MQKSTALLFASLIAVMVLVGVMRAQTIQPEREYRIVSGADIGFRIEGTDASGKPSGRWMIRVNGLWVEPSHALVGRPAGDR
jgi:hypothetical protein